MLDTSYITDEQLSKINILCKYLNKIKDEDVEYLTAAQADILIAELEEEKNKLIGHDEEKVIDFFKYYGKKRVKTNKKYGYVDWF